MAYALTRAVSRPKGELTHMYANHFTPYMPTKFQLSILINKKVGLSALRKGHCIALGRMNPRSISLYSISYQQYS